VLLGVSPDYAVVAQKGSEDSQAVSRFDGAFGQDYGVGLDSLALNYDRSVGDRLDEILARVNRSAEFEAQLRQAQVREAEVAAQLRQAQSETEAIRHELHALHQSNVHHWQLAEERGQHVRSLLTSTSWRITAPLRWVTKRLGSLGRIPGKVVQRLKVLMKPHVVRRLTHTLSKRLLERTGRWVIAHPRLLKPIRSALRRNEPLRNRVRWLVLGVPVQRPVGGGGMRGGSEPLPLAHLTPRARRIYQDLLDAITAKGRTS
jgi:O-antigen chain-terminating methyltransferase